MLLRVQGESACCVVFRGFGCQVCHCGAQLCFGINWLGLSDCCADLRLFSHGGSSYCEAFGVVWFSITAVRFQWLWWMEVSCFRKLVATDVAD